MDDTFRRLMFNIRDKAMKAAGLRELGPPIREHHAEYVSVENWNKMCDYWLDSGFSHKSKVAHINRAEHLVLHTGGSIPVSDSKKRLSQKRDREVSQLEVYKSTHSKSDGTPLDERARKVLEAYEAEDDDDVEVLTTNGGTSVNVEGECSRSMDVNMTEGIDVDEIQAALDGSRATKDFDVLKWKKAVGPTKKRYVLGFGALSDTVMKFMEQHTQNRHVLVLVLLPPATPSSGCFEDVGARQRVQTLEETIGEMKLVISQLMAQRNQQPPPTPTADSLTPAADPPTPAADLPIPDADPPTPNADPPTPNAPPPPNADPPPPNADHPPPNA